jgi:hypothetical protein
MIKPSRFIWIISINLYQILLLPLDPAMGVE